MPTFNTGNPIGSTDARDLSDNAKNMDYLENSTSELTHADRLGTVRKTRHGMEVEHGNQIAAHEVEHDKQIAAHESEHDAQIAAHESEHDAQMQAFESDFDGRLAGMAFTRVGSFTTGATLTDMRQVLIWEVSQGGDGHEYGWAGAFPKVVAAGATPATTGGIGVGAWVDQTDVVLRSDLAATTGAGLVGTTDGITVQAKLNAIAADKANTATVISRTKKGGLTTAVAGGAMTLTQAKRLFSFRNATLTDGTAVEVTPAADMTLTVPSGASLGAASGVPAEYLEILLYNGGIPVVGIVNAACGLNLDESGLISSSAISAISTSETTVYSSVAVANSPYIVLNRLTATLPTTGVWSVQPNVQPMDLTGHAILKRKLVSPVYPTTTGTIINVTGIPSWAKQITLVFQDVSTATASTLLVRVGNSALLTSGYSSTSIGVSWVPAGGSAGVLEVTSGFAIRSPNASGLVKGRMSIFVSPTKVVEDHMMLIIADESINYGVGDVELTGGVTQLSLTNVGGYEFDAGSFYCIYEG